MTAYYNEFDHYAAQWLRNLIKIGQIAPGDVDERSISDVQSDDLRGYDQCHFFAGIGVWSYALRRAGWPDDRPVEPGSFPLVAGPAPIVGRGSPDWHTPAGPQGASHRAGRLKDYGNALCAESAVAFIESVIDITDAN